jgi:hypothetical protein
MSYDDYIEFIKVTSGILSIWTFILKIRAVMVVVVW